MGEGGKRKEERGLGGSLAPRLLGSFAVGVGLEMLDAFCVETAQFFFDHFREMQYPLFGAVERGRVRLGIQPKVAEIQKCTERYSKCIKKTAKNTHLVSKKLLTINTNRAKIPLYRVAVDSVYTLRGGGNNGNFERIKLW